MDADVKAAGRDVLCPACGAECKVPSRTIRPGVVIGGFCIQNILGRGGMGEVYLAHQESLDRMVALKILPPQMTLRPALVERFLKEVRMAARLNCPNVVRAYQAGEDSGVYYLAMEYVEGKNLEEALMEDAPLDETKALLMVDLLAAALQLAWDKHKLLHRDIKPANIMIDRNDEPQLMDMGLSKTIDDSQGLTMTGEVMGSPNYMSPEQAEGQVEVDTRSDMYSLGATLYHMVTGEIPFHGSSLMHTIRRQATESLQDPRDLNPKVSDGCARLLERMMAKDPAERHPDWESLRGDIEQILEGNGISRQGFKAGSRIQRRQKTNWFIWLLPVGIIIALTAYVLSLFSDKPRLEPNTAPSSHAEHGSEIRNAIPDRKKPGTGKMLQPKDQRQLSNLITSLPSTVRRPLKQNLLEIDQATDRRANLKRIMSLRSKFEGTPYEGVIDEILRLKYRNQYPALSDKTGRHTRPSGATPAPLTSP